MQGQGRPDADLRSDLEPLVGRTMASISFVLPKTKMSQADYDSPPPTPPFKGEHRRIRSGSSRSTAYRHSSLTSSSTPCCSTDYRPKPLSKASSAYSFTSSPTLEGGPNSPLLAPVELAAVAQAPSSSAPVPPHSSFALKSASVGSRSGQRLAERFRRSSTAPTVLMPQPHAASAEPEPSPAPPPSAFFNGPNLKGSVRSGKEGPSRPTIVTSGRSPSTSSWNAFHDNRPTLVPLAGEGGSYRDAAVPETTSNLGSRRGKSSGMLGVEQGARELKRKGSRIFASLRKTSANAVTGLLPSPSVTSLTAPPPSPARKGSSTSISSDWTLASPATEDGQDPAIGLPFNVSHNIHIQSDDLSSLPPDWVEALKVGTRLRPSTTPLQRLIFLSSSGARSLQRRNDPICPPEEGLPRVSTQGLDYPHPRPEHETNPLQHLDLRTS